MTKKDWGSIFDAIGVAWCYGPACENGDRISHSNGFIERSPALPIVHWTDRRPVYVSIHKALRVLARGLRPDLIALPKWRYVFLVNREMATMARAARLRLPRKLFDYDRARLRYLLSEYTAADVRRMTPSEKQDFKAATRWAARS